MKREYGVYAVFAAACAALALTGDGSPLGFPLAPLGGALRQLSLAGGAGNGIAWLLYLIWGLGPLALMALMARRRLSGAEDALLLLLCAMGLGFGYLSINPGLLANWSVAFPGGKLVMLNLGLWADAVAWVVLKALRAAFEREDRLYACARGLARVLALAFVFAAFYLAPRGFLQRREALYAANTAMPQALGLTTCVLLLGQAIAALPSLLGALIALGAAQLMAAMQRDRYGEQTLARANALSRLCRFALTLSVLGQLALVLAQLALAPGLYDLNIHIVLPLSSLAFAMAVLLLSRMVGEGKRLKEDSELIV